MAIEIKKTNVIDEKKSFTPEEIDKLFFRVLELMHSGGDEDVIKYTCDVIFDNVYKNQHNTTYHLTSLWRYYTMLHNLPELQTEQVIQLNHIELKCTRYSSAITMSIRDITINDKKVNVSPKLIYYGIFLYYTCRNNDKLTKDEAIT